MPRIARIVAVDMPHHVIQRGNRRQKVFLKEIDKQKYLELLFEKSQEHGLKVWAYCLMDNHVHLIVVPEQETSLAKAVGETHKCYTRMINFREGWRGYLWEGRFKSHILDERYLYAAVKYVECNPVRAKLIKRAQDYPWSSAKNHVYKTSNVLLTPFYLMDEIDDWARYLAEEEREEDVKLMRRHGITERPLGTTEFLDQLKRRLGLEVNYKKPGPKIE